MNKEFKIGDKIKFIRSNDFGVIKEIISERKVKVEDSSNFIVQVNKDEIILQDDSTNSVSSYGDLSKIKDDSYVKRKKEKKVSNLNVMKVDLHIENLITDYHLMTNQEIIHAQIKKCEDVLMKSLNSNVQKLVIVHGIGEGVLKKEVHNLLNKYEMRYFESLNGGSTEVMI